MLAKKDEMKGRKARLPADANNAMAVQLYGSLEPKLYREEHREFG